jgi:hypothetical protein
MAEPVQVHRRRLTLFGRSVILLSGVLLANVVCWVIAGLTFRQSGLISLALLAWVSPTERHEGARGALMLDTRIKTWAGRRSYFSY